MLAWKRSRGGKEQGKKGQPRGEGRNVLSSPPRTQAKPGAFQTSPAGLKPVCGLAAVTRWARPIPRRTEASAQRILPTASRIKTRHISQMQPDLAYEVNGLVIMGHEEEVQRARFTP